MDSGKDFMDFNYFGMDLDNDQSSSAMTGGITEGEPGVR
jgi:hypothetical protein